MPGVEDIGIYGKYRPQFGQEHALIVSNIDSIGCVYLYGKCAHSDFLCDTTVAACCHATVMYTVLSTNSKRRVRACLTLLFFIIDLLYCSMCVCMPLFLTGNDLELQLLSALVIT